MPKYLLTTLATILIVIAVLIPGSNIPSVDLFQLDKFVHFIMFAGWAIAVRHDVAPGYFSFPVAFFSGCLFSVLTEVLQILVDGRTFDLYDMFADALGLATGLLIGNKVLSVMIKLKLTKKEKAP